MNSINTSDNSDYPAPPGSARAWANVLALLAPWLFLWEQLAHEWLVNEQYGYALFVPVLGGYLIYRRWLDRPEPVPAPGGIGLTWALLIGVAILLYPAKILFDANADWRGLTWTQGVLALVVSWRLCGHWGGRPWQRHFLPALAFWLFCIPWLTAVENPVTDGLMRLVAGWVVETANVLGVFAERSGNVIRLSNGVVSVEEACSGVRSLQSTLMAAYFLGELLRFPGTARGVLMLAGSLLAVLFNYTRTMTLTLIAAKQGTETMERWHDPAGHAVFIMCLAGLLLLAAALRRWVAPRPALVDGAPPPETYSPPRCLPSGPLVALLVIMLGTLAAVPAWYAWRAPTTSLAGWTVNWQGAGPDLRFEDISPRIYDILHYDTGEFARWSGPGEMRWMAYFLRWDDARSAQLGGIHNPEACLPATGWEMIEKGDNFTWHGPDGLELVFNTYTFMQDETRLFVFYCQWDRTAFPYHEKVGRQRADRFRDAWLGERKEGKTKLELFAYNARDKSAALRALQRFLDQSVQALPSDDW